MRTSPRSCDVTFPAVSSTKKKSKVLAVGKRIDACKGSSRESQEASQSHRGRHCLSPRAGVRDGSAGGRSETQRVGGGGRRVSPRASHSSDLGFAATNRHSGPRARFVCPPQMCRSCELRNTLEFWDRATIASLGALVAQGSACLAGLTPDVSHGWPRPIIPHVSYD